MTFQITHDDLIQQLEKSSDKFPGVDLYKCSTQELERLIDISNNRKKGIDSSEDRLYVSNLASKTSNIKERLERRFRNANSYSNLSRLPILNSKSNTMTRLDKIALLKGSDPFVTNKIDLFNLKETDLDKLVEIVNKQARGFSIGWDDHKVINQIRNDQLREKPVGKWSK